ncbi:MAG: hypothetical protein LBE53_02900 [Paucimonas sp.]|jgi:hypothetical protein|nr:hypothetical protein [Paucimonas sp.]
MANRKAGTLGVAGAIDLEPSGPREIKFEAAGRALGDTPLVYPLGETQRPLSSDSQGHNAQASPHGTPVLHEEPTDSMQNQLRELDLLQEQNDLLQQLARTKGNAGLREVVSERPAMPREPPGISAPGPEAAFEDFLTSLASAGGSLLLGKAFAHWQLQNHNISSVIPSGQGRYPLGLDAMPTPTAGRPAGTWLAVSDFSKEFMRLNALDILMKSIHAGVTADTPEQQGEAWGGLAGHVAGLAAGHGVAKKLNKNTATFSLLGSFLLGKIGGITGKELMSSPERQAEPVDPATSRWGTVLAASGALGAIGVSAGASRLPPLGETWRKLLGKGSQLDDLYPLGADAGPSPTGINSKAVMQAMAEAAVKPKPGFWSGLQEVAKGSGKLLLMEAALKSVATVWLAKTPEEKGAGYGGAIGGAIGGVLGGVYLGRVLSPLIGRERGMEAGIVIGNFVGDNLGSEIGAQIGKRYFTPRQAPLPAVSLLASSPMPTRQHLDAQVGVRLARQLSSVSLEAQRKRTRPLPAVSLMNGTNRPVGEYLDEQVGARIARKLMPVSAKGPRRQPVMPAVSLINLTHKPGGEFVDDEVGVRIARRLLAPSSEGRQGQKFELPAKALSLASLTQGMHVERLDEQLGTRVARRAFAAVAFGSGAAPVSRGARDVTLEGPGDGATVVLRQPAIAAAVPQPVLSLPELEARPQGNATGQSISQQITFNANVPVTVQGSVDAPNLLAQELEAAVRRVMLDLQRQAYNAQLADHPNPF